MKKRKRRNYTQEFKEEAVKLITEQGYSFAEAGRNLGVNPNLPSRWKRDVEEDVGKAIDKKGKTAQAMRTILSCASAKGHFTHNAHETPAERNIHSITQTTIQTHSQSNSK